MKLSFLILSAAAFQLATAGVPVKAPAVKYTGLWTNSPFTSKPPIKGPIDQVNPFDDYMLTGIAPVPGGYRITIANKKKPDEPRIVLEPGKTEKFKVVSVDRNPTITLGTTVVLSSGTMQGTVSFEPELVTLKAPPVAAQQNQGNANLPPGITPAMAGQQGNQGGNNVRQPRPRIVAPATPAVPGNALRGATSSEGSTGRTQGGARKNNSQQRTQHRR